MSTMGLEIGPRRALGVIRDGGQLLTHGYVETAPESVKTAHGAMAAAVYRKGELLSEHRIQMTDVKAGHLGIEDTDCIAATGYGRAVVPFSHGRVIGSISTWWGRLMKPQAARRSQADPEVGTWGTRRFQEGEVL